MKLNYIKICNISFSPFDEIGLVQVEEKAVVDVLNFWLCEKSPLTAEFFLLPSFSTSTPCWLLVEDCLRSFKRSIAF